MGDGRLSGFIDLGYDYLSCLVYVICIFHPLLSYELVTERKTFDTRNTDLCLQTVSTSSKQVRILQSEDGPGQPHF